MWENVRNEEDDNIIIFFSQSERICIPCKYMRQSILSILFSAHISIKKQQIRWVMLQILILKCKIAVGIFMSFIIFYQNHQQKNIVLA